MNEDIREVIWNEVWFGFNPKERIISILDDNFSYDELPDERELNKEIERVLALKQEHERTWVPKEESDFFKLSRAFDNLHQSGIIAVHNAGYTQSDCLDTVSEILEQVNQEGIIGYCFYHEQDIEKLIPESTSVEINLPEGNLLLGFGSLHENPEVKDKIPTLILSWLERCNLRADWNGDYGSRIEIKDFTWQKRLDEEEWSGYRSVYLLNEYFPNRRIVANASRKKPWQFWKK